MMPSSLRIFLPKFLTALIWLMPVIPVYFLFQVILDRDLIQEKHEGISLSNCGSYQWKKIEDPTFKHHYRWYTQQHDACLEATVQTTESGNYQLWLNAGHGSDHSLLEARIEQSTFRFNHYRHTSPITYDWQSSPSILLDKGSHQIFIYAKNFFHLTHHDLGLIQLLPEGESPLECCRSQLKNLWKQLILSLVLLTFFTLVALLLHNWVIGLSLDELPASFRHLFITHLWIYAGFLFVYVYQFGVNIPFYDSWNYISFLGNTNAQEWSWFFEPINGVQLTTLQRTITFLNASLNHWNQVHEMYLSAALIVLTTYVLYRWMLSLLARPSCFMLLLPLMICNLFQWENLLFAIQVSWMLVILFVSIAAMLSHRYHGTPKDIFVLMLIGACCILSPAHSILLLILIPAVLWSQFIFSQKKYLFLIQSNIIVTLSYLIFLILYFSLVSIPESPIVLYHKLVNYGLHLVASPMAYPLDQLPWFGASGLQWPLDDILPKLGILILCGIGYLILRHWKVLLPQSSILLLVMWGLGAAAMTAMGRYTTGLSNYSGVLENVAARYQGGMVLFIYVGILCLLLCIRQSSSDKKHSMLRLMLFSCITCLMVYYGSKDGLNAGFYKFDQMSTARQDMLEDRHDKAWKRLVWSRETYDAYQPILQKAALPPY